MLVSLSPAPELIRVRGYFRPPSHMATLPLDRVLMAIVAIEKPALGDGRREVVLDLPAE